MTEWTIGIDLGGTNLRAGLFGDGAAAAALLRKEPVGEPRDPATITEAIARLITGLLDDAGIAGAPVPVGVGIAAMLRDGRGNVVKSPHLRWTNVPFGAMLSERLGPQHPVTVANDVNAITWGEFVLGAGDGVDDILAVFVGTGIGAGLVVGGRLVEGVSHCAGEIGHFTVVYGDDALPCACGKRGCVEAYCGGTYLQSRIREAVRSGRAPRIAELAGAPERAHPGHLDQAAAEGDEFALTLYAEIAPLLAATLSNACTLLNPARLVLGGGVLLRTPVFREHVVAAMEVTTIPAILEPLEIVETVLGDDAGLVGSALLAARDLDR